MFERVVKELPSLKQIKLAAFAVGLVTKTPVERSVVMKGLTALQQQFPDLTESDFVKSDNKRKELFRLQNSEQNIPRQFGFSLKDYSDFSVVWGQETGFGQESQLVRLFDCLQDGFDIHPLVIANIDAQISLYTEVPVNHYRAIWEAYYSGSPIHKAFKPETILDDDLSFRFAHGEHRVVVVQVQSTISDSGVRLEKFDQSKLFLKYGIGQTKGFPANARLSNLIVPHVRELIESGLSSFIPFFVKPVDEALDALAKQHAS